MDNDQDVSPVDGTASDPVSQSRLDTEWTTLVALRSVMKIATKGSREATTSYRSALALGARLYPDLFDPEVSLIHQQNLSETAQKYIQLAEAESRHTGTTVTAQDVMHRRITYLQELIAAGMFGSEVDLLKKERDQIARAVDELTEAKNSENALIFRDALQVERNLPGSEGGRSYRQYRLNQDRVLRIRVLHPDKPEHVTGVDMLYEHYWDRGDTTLVRLAAVQYKLWRKDRVLHIDPRAERQMSKMEQLLCTSEHTLCAGPTGTDGTRYRLPFCAAFVRPSDELQPNDAKLMSKGLYVPTCVVRRAMANESRKRRSIASKEFRSESVTHTAFEELFNCNLLGSRWIEAAVLEEIYRANKVIQPSERILIHAQEFTAAG